MGQPTINLYCNTGTEGSPTWTEITSSKTIYWCGPDTTSSFRDPVTAPASTYKWCEELWIGDDPYASSGQQVGTYVIPTAATQYAKVLKYTFTSYGTSTAPILTAYLSSGDRTTLTDEIFVGTSGHAYPYLKATDTGIESSVTTPAQNWCSESTQTGGSADPNALKGDTDYVTHSVTPGAGDNIMFAIACFVPYNATSGTAGKTCVLTLKYTYT